MGSGFCRCPDCWARSAVSMLRRSRPRTCVRFWASREPSCRPWKSTLPRTGSRPPSVVFAARGSLRRHHAPRWWPAPYGRRILPGRGRHHDLWHTLGLRGGRPGGWHCPRVVMHGRHPGLFIILRNVGVHYFFGNVDNPDSSESFQGVSSTVRFASPRERTSESYSQVAKE